MRPISFIHVFCLALLFFIVLGCSEGEDVEASYERLKQGEGVPQSNSQSVTGMMRLCQFEKDDGDNVVNAKLYIIVEEADEMVIMSTDWYDLDGLWPEFMRTCQAYLNKATQEGHMIRVDYALTKQQENRLLQVDAAGKLFIFLREGDVARNIKNREAFFKEFMRDSDEPYPPTGN